MSKKIEIIRFKNELLFCNNIENTPPLISGKEQIFLAARNR